MITMELFLLLCFACCQSLRPLTEGNAGEGGNRWNSSELDRIQGKMCASFLKAAVYSWDHHSTTQSCYWAPSMELGV